MNTFNIYTISGSDFWTLLMHMLLLLQTTKLNANPPTPILTIWMILGFRKLDTMLAMFNLAIYA